MRLSIYFLNSFGSLKMPSILAIIKIKVAIGRINIAEPKFKIV